MLAPVTPRPVLERRQGLRLPVAVSVLVVSLRPTGLVATTATMVDVSGGGARFSLEGTDGFERGTELLLVDVGGGDDGRHRLARVVDCRPGTLHVSFTASEVAPPVG
jgi:hypothetical protein